MNQQHTSKEISVIIPSYNSINTIGKTIEGLLSQSDPTLINEIIIIDSSDDELTHDFLKSKENGFIKVKRSGYRVMPAIQRNIGAKMAQGKLLCFIDSDAFPDARWAERIRNEYSSGHLAGGGSYKIPDFQKTKSIAYAQYFLEFSEFIGYGKKRHKDRFPSCNLFCEKELFFKVGGFPEIRASEDSLFSIEASKHTRMIYNPEIVVYHIFRETSKHFLSNQRLLGKYIYIFRRKTYNPFYFRGNLPYILITFFLAFKVLRIFIRVIRTGFNNVFYFFKSLPVFILGVIMWGRGFLDGVKSYHMESNKIKFNTGKTL